MGKTTKFDHDKSYKVIAFQAVNEILDAIEKAKALDGTYPKFTVIIEGSSVKTFEVPQSNVPEIIEVLKLSSVGQDD